MIIKQADNLVCPIDGNKLTRLEKQYTCDNGHTFDIARQGYVNLLPVQHKRSKEPGDSKEMVVARTEFLSTAIYETIADKLAQLSLSHIHLSSTTIVDAGCGEGYYFDYLCEYLKKVNNEDHVSFIGLDISKYAILEAARKNKDITWIVGTNRQPPFEVDSVDIILCVFGFQSYDGFTQILKTKGKVILVEAGSEHLKELREVIYDEVKVSEPPSLTEAEQLGFSLIDSQEIKYESKELNNQEINQLLLMTPHFFRANKEGQKVAMGLDNLTLTINVVFRILEKQ